MSNVADGHLATDALNSRQLDGAVNQANQYTDARIAAIDTSAVVVDQNLTEFSTRVGKVEGNVQTLRIGTSGLLQVSQSSAVQAAPSVTGNNDMTVEVGATASGDNSTAMGNGAAANAPNSTAVGNGTTASPANSAAVGVGSIADRANSVSVGSLGNERQITTLGGFSVRRELAAQCGAFAVANFCYVAACVRQGLGEQDLAAQRLGFP